jgi:hypothetical protein
VAPDPQLITEDGDPTVLGDATTPCVATAENRWRCSLAGALQSAAR